MPKFKVGDRISNGKTEYTVLDIETNSYGNLCYRFNNSANSNFLWITSQVDKMFELVEDNDYWESFRNQAAKDILCQVITFEEVTVALTKARISKERAVSIAIDYADELIKQLKKEVNYESKVS